MSPNILKLTLNPLYLTFIQSIFGCFLKFHSVFIGSEQTGARNTRRKYNNLITCLKLIEKCMVYLLQFLLGCIGTSGGKF